MRQLLIEQKEQKKEEYNQEPVTFCKKCLSLNIKISEDNVDYCVTCGCTDMNVAFIENWEELYTKRYGVPILRKREKSFI